MPNDVGAMLLELGMQVPDTFGDGQIAADDDASIRSVLRDFEPFRFELAYKEAAAKPDENGETYMQRRVASVPGASSLPSELQGLLVDYLNGKCAGYDAILIDGWADEFRAKYADVVAQGVSFVQTFYDYVALHAMDKANVDEIDAAGEQMYAETVADGAGAFYGQSVDELFARLRGDVVGRMLARVRDAARADAEAADESAQNEEDEELIVAANARAAAAWAAAARL